MEISSCCGAPVTVEYQSDLPNFTDDDYDLKVPVRICARCGAVMKWGSVPADWGIRRTWLKPRRRLFLIDGGRRPAGHR